MSPEDESDISTQYQVNLMQAARSETNPGSIFIIHFTVFILLYKPHTQQILATTDQPQHTNKKINTKSALLQPSRQTLHATAATTVIDIPTTVKRKPVKCTSVGMKTVASKEHH